ncbi:MAG: aconitate hydratase AcnA [Thaumarchaeota archaeon]|nr:aconitate hydratase AcnA [Nitrososphaerota archaeon]
MAEFDSFVDHLASPEGLADFYSLRKLESQGHDLAKLPYSIRVLLENSVRNAGHVGGATEAAHRLLEWPNSPGHGFPFMPHRVLLQDYTGVPLIVDLAAMRDAMRKRGRDPEVVNSIVPMDLVIDHSVQVDGWSNVMAFGLNIEKEYERNSERYSLLKWSQDSFKNMRVFPPGKGICHQVNLEYLSSVVALSRRRGGVVAVPDTLVGTDSHTTMVNGLGVLGWGVGGIEAEAVMLGEPYHMPIPKVVGVKLLGSVQEGTTPTDVVLTVTELLRSKNVVDAFVEYFGEGYQHLSVPDRATLGNMSPEYGATAGFSPVDAITLRYLRDTGRDPAHIKFVEDYCKVQGLFARPDSPEPKYSEVLVVDLSKIEPCIAGPRNPEERRLLSSVPAYAASLIQEVRGKRGSTAPSTAPLSSSGGQTLVQQQRGSGHGSEGLDDGGVIIAAITSCTNTSNPTVMIGAGLIAKAAAERGLRPKPYVKCSLAPGSMVVKDYLEGSGLLTYLDDLGFNLVGYGCTTCIGNSGPLDPVIESEIKRRDLYAVAVLSGNRNFDGRIHPLAKGSFLMSPMLVVAYALAGRMDFDFKNTPLGTDNRDGRPVFLKDLWPSLAQIRKVAESSLSGELYRRRYADALAGDEKWESLSKESGETFGWEPDSTYVREPPWFEPTYSPQERPGDIIEASVLAVLGDKITTDHISPAGSIPIDSPAGEYLLANGVEMVHFSTYGSRRGNHEVMVRGGFANIRLRNSLAEGREGGYTKHFPSGEIVSIYEASQRYLRDSVPLIILAGKQYGSGSSRDWAAKAPKMLGVKAVIAENFERIHRSNLVAMGVLPLEFMPGESAANLRLAGDEILSITGIRDISIGKVLEVTVMGGSSPTKNFKVKARIDNEAEMSYYASGGVLPYVLGQVLQSAKP